MRDLSQTKETKGCFDNKVIWIISRANDVPYEEPHLFDISLSESEKHNKDKILRDFHGHTLDVISSNFLHNVVFNSLACGLPLMSEADLGIEKLKLKKIKIVHPE